MLTNPPDRRDRQTCLHSVLMHHLALPMLMLAYLYQRTELLPNERGKHHSAFAVPRKRMTPPLPAARNAPPSASATTPAKPRVLPKKSRGVVPSHGPPSQHSNGSSGRQNAMRAAPSAASACCATSEGAAAKPDVSRCAVSAVAARVVPRYTASGSQGVGKHRLAAAADSVAASTAQLARRAVVAAATLL